MGFYKRTEQKSYLPGRAVGVAILATQPELCDLLWESVTFLGLTLPENGQESVQ